MARATAHCTCKTCGKEFTYSKICYNRRDADDFEEWAAEHIDECDECREARLRKERDEENAHAAALAAENDLPELHGSEKQVAWALSLRQRAIDAWLALDEESRNRTRNFMDYILEHAVSAKEWIDERNDNAQYMLESIARNYRDGFRAQKTEKNPQDEVSKREVEKETIVTPENSNGVAVRIEEKDNQIRLSCERNEEFIKIAKAHDYQWDPEDRVWSRKLGIMVGPFADRAAEIGHALLVKGFPIRIDDEMVRQNAIEGKFVPECRFWVLPGAEDGKLVIRMNERSEERYQAARRLPGAKYVSGDIIVSAEHYEKIQKFAEKYGFRVSENAQALMDEVASRPVTKIESK